jgi:hypothetical protein
MTTERMSTQQTSSRLQTVIANLPNRRDRSTWTELPNGPHPTDSTEMVPEVLAETMAKLHAAGYKLYLTDTHTFTVRPPGKAPEERIERHYQIVDPAGNVVPYDNRTDYPHGEGGILSMIYDVIGPVVGAPATVIMFSDRHAATVSKVLFTKDGRVKGVEVQQDRAERIDTNGMSESQDYRFERDPEGQTYDARRVERNGRIYWIKGTIKDRNYSIGLGARSEYYDFSF